MDASYLPSQRVIIFGTGVFAILLLVIGFHYTPFFSNANTNSQAPISATAVSTSTAGAANIDTPDTDSANPLSSADYTTNRNATQFNRNGTATPSTLPDGRVNKTQQRFAEIAPKIAELSSSGGYTDSELRSILRQSLAGEFKPPEEITREDITIIDNSNSGRAAPQRAKTYGERVTTTIFSYEEKQVGSELAVVARGLQQNNQSKLEELAKISDDYGKMVEELRQVPVPEEFVTPHLQLLNGLARVEKAIAEMQYYLDDPLRAQLAAEAYRTATQEVEFAQDAIVELVNLQTE